MAETPHDLPPEVNHSGIQARNPLVALLVPVRKLSTHTFARFLDMNESESVLY